MLFKYGAGYWSSCIVVESTTSVWSICGQEFSWLHDEFDPHMLLDLLLCLHWAPFLWVSRILCVKNIQCFNVVNDAYSAEWVTHLCRIVL